MDKIKGRKQKKVIVISHSPPAGINDKSNNTHKGFDCFLDFIRQIKPLLWMHGHVHLQAFNEIKKTDFYGCTVVNVFEFKKICVDGGVEVGYKLTGAEASRTHL